MNLIVYTFIAGSTVHVFPRKAENRLTLKNPPKLLGQNCLEDFFHPTGGLNVNDNKEDYGLEIVALHKIKNLYNFCSLQNCGTSFGMLPLFFS
jgi:hypothetical protein